MVVIHNLLDFKLYKNDILKINKNNIAYSKKSDKIMFVLDDNTFNLLLNNEYYELEKESNDNIFKINGKESSIYLKEHAVLMPIKVEESYISVNDNKYTIKYKLESDNEHTTIEIIL